MGSPFSVSLLVIWRLSRNVKDGECLVLRVENEDLKLLLNCDTPETCMTS